MLTDGHSPTPPRQMWFLKALLDLRLLNSLLVQILDELVTLHPVDERTDVSAVPEEGAARKVDGTSCRGEGQRGRMWDTPEVVMKLKQHIILTRGSH